MLLGLIHKFLNLVAPPITFFSLLFLWPPFEVYKFFISILGSVFAEDVAGKVVIVTGASSGIGEHLAYEYAKRGARLALAARRKMSLQEVANRALELGSPDAIVIQADVSKLENCRRIVDQTISHFGRLDHLVNNAGMITFSLFEDVEDVTSLRSLMDINFWGTVYMTHLAVPHLRKNYGRIIVISSSATWLPAPRMSLYNASKAAMSQFFETLRIELWPDIKITLVTPGFIKSEITQGKHLNKAGKVAVNTDMRDVQVNIIPMEKVDACAKAIVNSACRGERYLTEPAWFKVTHWWKVFFPEAVEYSQMLLSMSSPGSPPEDALGKKILDYTGCQKILYPETVIHDQGPKTD